QNHQSFFQNSAVARGAIKILTCTTQHHQHGISENHGHVSAECRRFESDDRLRIKNQCAHQTHHDTIDDRISDLYWQTVRPACLAPSSSCGVSSAKGSFGSRGFRSARAQPSAERTGRRCRALALSDWFISAANSRPGSSGTIPDHQSRRKTHTTASAKDSSVPDTTISDRGG